MTSRPITKIEKTSGGYFIEGILDDGTVDTDGMRFDPAWFRQAAAEWLITSPNLKLDWFDSAGTGTEIRSEGDTTIIRALITDIVARSMITSGAITQFSVGVARPTVETDPVAPGGVVTDGTLAHVGLIEDHRASQGSDESHTASGPSEKRQPAPARPGT